MDCTSYIKKLVPMIRCVNAAIVDSYEDIGKVQERYIFWAARHIKTLNRQILKANRRYAIITVNRSTNTATLPVDCDELTFVGVLDENNEKIPLKVKNNLGNSKYDEIECEDKCPKCNQNTGICNDLTVTEDVKLVTINDSVYEQTIVKKLYPDGSYFLETRIPLWDIEAGTVVYTTTKELVNTLSLKPCGCIDDTPENVEVIRTCAPDVYCCYYASCNNSCTEDYGGYKVFEQTGLIQLDNIGKFKKLYIEYWGFLPKKNGQYQVPEVAFETVVEHIKFMAIDGKRNVSTRDKMWRYERYKIQRGNMEKEIGRIGLSQIMQAAMSIPKFDIDYPELCGGCLTVPSTAPVTTSDETDCDATPAVQRDCPAPAYTIFSISTIAGSGDGTPVPGTNVFQDSRLKGALGVVLIVVNNTNETIADQQFTIDTGAGIITRYQADGVTPNPWQTGDILIVPTFFKYS